MEDHSSSRGVNIGQVNLQGGGGDDDDGHRKVLMMNMGMNKSNTCQNFADYFKEIFM